MEKNMDETIDFLKNYIESHREIYTPHEKDKRAVQNYIISKIGNVDQCFRFMDNVIRAYCDKIPNRSRRDLVDLEIILLNTVERLINNVKENEDRELIKYLETELESRHISLLQFIRKRI